MLQYLENLQKERFTGIRDHLSKVHSGVSAQEAISSYTLSTDNSIKEMALFRFQEVTENALAAERELYIERLSHEITALNEKLLVGKQTEKDASETLETKK